MHTATATAGNPGCARLDFGPLVAAHRPVSRGRELSRQAGLSLPESTESRNRSSHYCGRYGGENKKGIFSLMNYWLPLDGIMPMHCSANVGAGGDCAIFFGLSGTGAC